MKPENDKKNSLDSPINTEGTGKDNKIQSRTVDLNADEDPTDRDDIPSKEDEKRLNDRTRFDGEIDI